MKLGGRGRADNVTQHVMDAMQLSTEERGDLMASGAPRVRNQIHWARFFLAKAGLIASPLRGEWALTSAGREIDLVNEMIQRQLIERVRAETRTPAEDEEETAAPPDDLQDHRIPGLPSALQRDMDGVEEEQGDDSDTIHSPYDPAKTQIITKPMSVEQLAKRMAHDEIDLSPDFQRKSDLWSDAKKSQLIESMLIRIPLPVFYFDATDDSNWLVVDGLQRLSTIRHFMVPRDGSPLKLQGLEYLKQHNDKTFAELPRDLRRRIEETQVFAHLIQPGTPSEVKFNIFKRINTGGLVLTPQEIRHALYQKKGVPKSFGAPQFLRELANFPEFLRATDYSIGTDRLLNCEFVLRFLAFTITPYQEYAQDNMDEFLNQHMQRLNTYNEIQLNELRRKFKQAMSAAFAIFDNDAFRKRRQPTDRRQPLNKALFEVWSVTLGRMPSDLLEQLTAKKTQLRTLFAERLTRDWAFEASVSQGTGTSRRVALRFSSIEDLIALALKDDSCSPSPA